MFLQISTRISGYANPVIAPIDPLRSSSSRNTPPSPPKMPSLFPILDLIELIFVGVGGSSSFKYLTCGISLAILVIKSTGISTPDVCG